MIIFLICGRLLPFFHKGFDLRRSGDDISSCLFIALVDKFIELVDRQTHLHAYFMQDICYKDAALLGGKGDTHEEKDNSVSECAKLISDELPEDGVESVFMLFMKPLAHPFAKADSTDLGERKMLTSGNALDLFPKPGREPEGRVN
jgi:hypothetical protein